MALTEDLSLFFLDFGVACTAKGVSATGILDMPSEIIADGVVLTTDYRLTARFADFGNLLYGDVIIIDNYTYQVREVRGIDDGALVEIGLSRLAQETNRLLTSSGLALTTLDGRYLVTA